MQRSFELCLRKSPVVALAGWLAFASVGCGGASGPVDAPDPTWTNGDQALTLTETASPVDGLPAGTRFYSNIKYGTDAQQAFDVFLPAATKPTAAVIWVHGGGFVNGSRTEVYGDQAGRVAELKQALAAGVAWVTLDYRLLAEIGVETEGVRKSLHDSRRALQFMRHYATTLNLDPKRIAMYGGSAGAGTSVWLGFHDDMKQPSNDDVIARQSTRLAAVAALQTQGTYDVLRWAPDILAPEYPFVSNDLLLSVKASVDLLLRFYGLPVALGNDTPQILETLGKPDYAAYRADLDLFELASPDDPPLFMRTTGPDTSPVAMGFDVLHHPLHPKTLLEKATTAGVPTIVADIPAYQIASSVAAMDFLLGYLD